MSMKSYSKRAKAFSLLEVLLTISILAVISILTINFITNYKKSVNIRLLQEKIMADMELAKTQAVASLKDVEIIFNDQGYYLQTSGEISKKIDLGRYFRVNYMKLGFTPAGSPKYAGTVYLFYRDEKIAKFILTPA